MFVREEGPQGPVPGEQREGKRERNRRELKGGEIRIEKGEAYKEGGTGRNMKHGMSKEEKRGRGRRRKESLWRLRKGRRRIRN